MTNRMTWVGFRAGLMAACLVLAACGGGGGAAPAVPAVTLFSGALPSAQFYRPLDVAQDAAGNVYVADTGNHTIRKVSRDGTLTTLAGAAGQTGSADGTGTDARFNGPAGVAVDATGNVYVADSGNSTLRKITPAGVVTTVAGAAGQPGYADGSAASARFRSPRSIAVDGAGNIYVTDDEAVRKLAPNGTVYPFAGKAGEQSAPTAGNGTLARFAFLSSVTVDGAGNVYVAESPNLANLGGGRLRKFDANAQALPFGPNPDGILFLTYPLDISADAAGNVYAALNGLDQPSPNFVTRYRSIVRITPDGLGKATVAGTDQVRTVDGPAASASFTDPRGIAVGPGGRIVVSETSTGAIRLIDTQQGNVSTLAGGDGGGAVDGPVAQARFNSPLGLAAAPDGTLYVADTGNNSIRKITPAGGVSTLTPFQSVRNVALGANGTLYVTGPVTTFGRSFSAIAADGKITSAGSASPNSPASALAADAAGNLFISDNGNIIVIAPGGAQRVLAAGLFPQALALDAAGDVYFTSNNGTVGVVDPSGKAVILAGRANERGVVDGTGQDARFNAPSTLALDPSGNMYVADGTKIRRIAPTGTVTTIADLAAIEAIQQAFTRTPLASVTGLAWTGGAVYASVFNSITRIAPVN